MKYAILILLAFELVISGVLVGQAPAGTITGFVTDATGARISGASLVITNQQSGWKRTVITSDAGDYSAPALLPGVYQVAAVATGFTQLAREATVEAGSTTTVNLALPVGVRTDSLTVEGTSPQIRYESHEIDGMISRPQIEDCRSMAGTSWS
jgi:Carboxypeptidase regulatory-like domain